MKQILFTVFCAIFLASASIAETRALLVGVSDYDDETGIVDLKGPANDVALLRDMLRLREVTDIRILADGVEGGIAPTRAAILKAFEDLAEAAQKGDFVYIHFSGHGTRQPDRNGDETDGLDEVFLPADTGRAQPGQNTIPNALLDDEIGAAVKKIRTKGANVWLVMDSCHSGSGLRAAAPGTAARFVDPAILGIAVASSPRPEAQIIEAATTVDQPSDGSFLAFYSARSTEVAREINLAPEGQPEAWYGLFSATLAARLQAQKAISFRQLFQAVLSDMNADHIPGGARLQTPSWEGPLIDAAVFGGEATTGLRRYAVSVDELAAGLVHGIPEGTLVGLVADAADGPEAIIGFAQTEDTTPTLSYLRPVAADCIPRSDGPCEFLGELVKEARFAQIIARPVDAKTHLRVPQDLVNGTALGNDHPTKLPLDAALERVNANAEQGIVLSDSDYSVEVIWDGTSLWFGPRVTAGDTLVGLTWTPGEGDLVPLLTRIARAEALARMLDGVAQNGSPLSPNPVRVIAAHNPVSVQDLAAIGRPISPKRECRKAVSQITAETKQPLIAGADLKQCDQLSFSVQGETAGARDVNRVHIDSKFCIFADYERVEGNAVSRRLGDDMTMCSDCPDGDGAGDERLFVIITEGKANSEALNLEGLIENCGAAAGGTRGGAATNQAMNFLSQIATRPDTRGSMSGFGISGIWVETFSWRVLPRREAFRQAGRALDN
ncbi:caspase family protein [Sulfitobacter sp. SK012]|uniref:caspase family protein n=1 Tax=Sulfitobacter sp. SK012 TaxID=1389005 RepID=UPI0013B3D647|nr:caspase family protein [Sulfitobacter sp. SK012]